MIEKKNNESWFWFGKSEIMNNELWIVNSQQELIIFSTTQLVD